MLTCTQCQLPRPSDAYLRPDGGLYEICKACREQNADAAGLHFLQTVLSPTELHCSQCGFSSPPELFHNPHGGLFKTCAGCRDRVKHSRELCKDGERVEVEVRKVAYVSRGIVTCAAHNSRNCKKEGCF